MKDRIQIVFWQDVLNISNCGQKGHNYRPLSVPDLNNVLKTLQDKLSALFYCHRDRTPHILNIFKEVGKSMSIQLLSSVKDFVSV